ncbi:MarR family transcriptional regulator [Cystobacter fuscus]|uniref:MarR family transcriptional regulator n=1 Tax=Cystobacter fuscus TaxID=43 RepID=A0A250J0V7_9BACT|nr:MarR family winged helix-turn-helix transcriptional regulator [Cystobacter fuscus]ATB37150.1 MarR family transcriptional regulator [Cystobacter fuscus]
MISVKAMGEGLRAPRLSTTGACVARRDPEEFLERLSALSQGLRLVAAREYATFEVGSTQAKFLRYIGRHGRISQAELARATGTDPTLTGRALETLIERGWVRRERSEEDRRQYVLELAEAGQRARRRVEDTRRRISVRLVAELDERDFEDFDRIMKKLLATLEESLEARSKP